MVLGTLASAAAAAFPGSSEAQAKKIDHLPSSLDASAIEKQKGDAADAIINDFWNQKPVREHVLNNMFPTAHNADDVRNALIHSSRMGIPSPTESAEVEKRSHTSEGHELAKGRLAELTHTIPVGKYGLYLDGDTQKLYLIQKLNDAKAQFVKSFEVSTSRTGWSNTIDSNGTPLGLHHIVERRIGKLGQVVSTLNPFEHVFKKVPVATGKKGTEMKTFVQSLRTGTEPAEMVTTAYLLWGPSTPIARGEYLHGTNREDLLGKPHSGGCVRMTSIDAYSLLGADEKGVPYIEAGTLRKDGRSAIGGTPLMIHVSQDLHKEEEAYRPQPGKVTRKGAKQEVSKKRDKLAPKKNPKKRDTEGWEDITGR